MAAPAFDAYPPRYPEYPIFDDRFDAGKELAKTLVKYRRRTTLLVLGISGHGIEVGFPIAQALRAPLDLAISSLLPIPGRPESSFGAVIDDTIVLNDGLVAGWQLAPDQIAHIATDVRDDARHRALKVRGDKPLPEIRGKTVLIVDDGLNVGFPIVAAIEWALKRKPRDVVVAIPVAPRHEIERLVPLVSEVVCLIQRDTWNLSIAAFYRHWQEPTDKQLSAYLRRASSSATA